jgi:hypothetical protein
MPERTNRRVCCVSRGQAVLVADRSVTVYESAASTRRRHPHDDARSPE